MTAAGSLRFESMSPEPARFWIRHAPTDWPGPEGWWIDLARAQPASRRLRATNLPPIGEAVFGDVVYVPPLEAAAELLRQELVERCADLGVPILQQVMPGDPLPTGDGPIVVDLTESLLLGRMKDLEIGAEVWAAWPLIPGLTDGESICARGLETLAAAGVVGVAPIVPALTPPVRRRLAEFGSAASYTELFHTDESDAMADFARVIAARGLEVFPHRPALERGRGNPNRALAGHFALLGELWLRCGRPEGRAQVFFRAARRLEQEPVDVAELARRRALGGVSWLDEVCREEVRQIASGAASVLLTELEEGYLGRTGDRDQDE